MNEKLINNKMILNPNCSEEVFKLEGTLEEIKREILKMLDIVAEEYAMPSGKIPTEIKKMKKVIRNLKSLEELRDICFPFTCNYTTYFNPIPKENTVEVATCNNHIWDGVNRKSIFGDSGEEYHRISRVKFYDVLKGCDKYLILKRSYDEKAKYLIIEPIEDVFPQEFMNVDYVEIRNLGDYYQVIIDSYKSGYQKIKAKEASKELKERLITKYILPKEI